MTTAVNTRAGEPMSSREAETYQRLRAHLDILHLGAAAEALTTVLDAARTQDLSLISAMERLLATEVAAVHARRHAGLVRFASLPAPYSLELSGAHLDRIGVLPFRDAADASVA